METWCERWNIKINEDKTRGVCFSRGRRPPESCLTLNGRNIPFVNSAKYLGVIFDKRVTWRLHIEMIEAEAFRRFIRVYSFFKSERLSANIKLTFHKALIRSVMTCNASPAWENRRVTITELSSHVLQISCSLLLEIVMEHLLFRKLCARWVPKQPTPEHKTKRMEMHSAGIVFLHDNTRPHTVQWTASLLLESSWEVFKYPPYSLDLTPSDFHLLHLKKFLSGERQGFENDREAETVVTQWFQSQAADFYDTGIQKLVPRYDKCFSSGCDYVEK
ncbi:hypothetical protein B7P43_G05325 [Cryptotermes secundus]|uniref:Histone-lysine N-methyltransferase SETMAR n=1 Tax=Cryptotermes secundus TaxID=105785 RepID=A0A2J7PW13_9NEOP|nr:hypothetical protein B7P43_G05325 [Cryptotermes secundus]